MTSPLRLLTVIGARQPVDLRAPFGGVQSTVGAMHSQPGGLLALDPEAARLHLYQQQGDAWQAVANLVLACATGLAAWLFGHPFLTTHTAHVDWPLVGELHLPSAFIFDLGVFTVVVGTTMLMLVALAHQSLRAHRLPGEDTPHHTPHDITHADGRAT